ncbi:MAG: DUF5688 family protein [Ruminococcus flavefaciens]|nr:DUF5688 family protein [Ruminococcus flavefaciens]
MYSDRQEKLKVFLRQLQQSVVEKAGEKVAVHSVTKADGKKFLEIVIGENPLFSPIIWVEESSTGYGKGILENVLQRIWAMYGKYKELKRRSFPFDKVKENLYLRLVHYERNKGFIDGLVVSRYLDLAVVPVVTLEESIGDSHSTLAVNIQKGMCGVSEDELLRTAYENGKKDCMIEGLEFSAEELGYEIFAMSNGNHFAMFDKRKLRDLAERIDSSVLFILPISIYEVFVIPEDNVFDVSELQEFSKNIRKLLDFEEALLSENVYRYSWKEDDIEFI